MRAATTRITSARKAATPTSTPILVPILMLTPNGIYGAHLACDVKRHLQ